MRLSPCGMAGVLTCAIATLSATTTVFAKTPLSSDALAAQVAELRIQVARLTDRQQINDVYLRYMRGFDRNDVQLLRSSFWPDVQINYGSQSNTLDEFVLKHLDRHVSHLASWGHLLTNETVDIDGDVAHVEIYVTALWVPKNDESFANRATIGGGRYIDRLDRRNGEWRIAMREFIPHFSTRTDTTFFHSFSKEPQWASECGMGTWDKRDPSYRRPLTRRASKNLGPICAE